MFYCATIWIYDSTSTLLKYESVGVRLTVKLQNVAVAQTIINLRAIERQEYISNIFI